MEHYSHTKYTDITNLPCEALQSHSSTQIFQTSNVDNYSNISVHSVSTILMWSPTVILQYTEFPNHPYGLLQSHMSKQSFNISHVEHYTHIYTEFPHLQCGALQSHYSTQRFHTFHVEHYTHSPVYRFSTAPKWSSPATLKYSVFLAFDMEH